MAENLRFPGEGSSSQGKSGAKARPRGVVDAQPVDIPVLPCTRPNQVPVAKGLFPSGNEPTHRKAVSNEGTQEDR